MWKKCESFVNKWGNGEGEKPYLTQSKGASE